MIKYEGPTKILKHLFIGSQSDAKSKATIDRFNITHILNCTPPKSVDPISGVANYFEREKGISYKRIPIFDNAGENILDKMDTAITFIDHAKHYGVVLVHCKKGISRSASFIIGYLMKVNEFSLSEALDYVKALRPTINPNHAFISQLSQYEALLQRQREVELMPADCIQFVGPCGPVIPIGLSRADTGSSVPESPNAASLAGERPLKEGIALDSICDDNETLNPSGDLVLSTVDRNFTPVVSPSKIAASDRGSKERSRPEEEWCQPDRKKQRSKS